MNEDQVRVDDMICETVRPYLAYAGEASKVSHLVLRDLEQAGYMVISTTASQQAEPARPVRNCGDCRFFDGGPQSAGYGSCHVRSVEAWPGRFKTDWCGEWQARAE